jgi:hypothetical protein
MTTPGPSDTQAPQPGSIPIPSSSPRKLARGPNGRFCSGGRSDAIVTRGAPLPSPATPPSQLAHTPQNPLGPSTSAGPLVPIGIPVRITHIFDHALVIQVSEIYSHDTTPLYIYQFTALCTGCNRLHDVNNECNLQPTFIGIDLDMPASYSKHSIPLPTLSWGQPPLRHEPGNGGPVAATFTTFEGEEAGYFLGRIQSYLEPNQYKWHISFQFQSCDKTREWTLDTPSHKVESLLETVMIILHAAPDRRASLKLRPTMLGSNNGIDASPPPAFYMFLSQEPVYPGDGKIFPVYPNLHRF